MKLRSTLSIAILALAGGVIGATTTDTSGSSITYTAAGVFGSTPISGADGLELAGEPFTVSVTVGSSAKPTQTGRNWALYEGLTLTGKVHSGLVGPAPVVIGSKAANIQQLVNPGQYDLFHMGAPLKIFSLNINLVADITLPAGTLNGPLVQTFNAVTLSPATASLTYYENGAKTVLPIQSGTLSAQ